MGDVFLLSPFSFWAITFLIAFIVVGLIVFGIFGEYARKERVVGVLLPSEGLVRIVPPKVGSFSDIYVSTGDNVEVGTPLLRLKDDTNLTNGQQLSDSLLEQLGKEKRNFEKRLGEIPHQFTLNLKRLKTQRSELQDQADRYIEQITMQSRTVKIQEGVLAKIQSLMDNEAASELEHSSAENQLISAQLNLSALSNTRKNILSEIKDIDAQIDLLPIQNSEAQTDIRNRIINIEKNIIRMDADRRYVINAPVSGTIATVIARKGQDTSSQKLAIAILPKGGKLQAELYVPTRSIGFVKKGQTVRLLYDAFPYQKFGFHEGVVANVSKTVVQGTDLPIAVNIQEPVFLVTVDVREQSIDALGEDIPLQSGMSLSADIIMEDRKIWEWVLEPLLRVAG